MTVSLHAVLVLLEEVLTQAQQHSTKIDVSYSVMCYSIRPTAPSGHEVC